jgi:membrane protease YdiL (CAAX protease family)
VLRPSVVQSATYFGVRHTPGGAWGMTTEGSQASRSTAAAGVQLDSVDHFLVFGLVGIRLVEGLLRFVALPEQPPWIFSLYYAGTYLFMALFMVRRRRNLSRFHLSSLTIALVIVAPLADPFGHWVFGGPLFRPPFNWTWRMVLDVPTIVISVTLALGLLAKRSEVHAGRDNPSWLLLALGLGCAGGYLTESIYALLAPPNPLTVPRELTPDIPATLIVSQLAKAAAMEEPVFRGILWGYLKERNWPGVRILVVQAALFWIAHIYHAVRFPLAFWIGVPFFGLLFGVVARRSRSAAASMLAHAAANTVGWLYGLFGL